MAEPRHNRLRFKLKGSTQDRELVRVEDFASWLDGVLACLNLLGEDLRSRPVLTVAGLSIGSAVLEIDVASVDKGVSAASLSERFATGFEYLQGGRLADSGFPPETRRAFEQLLKPMRRQLRAAELQLNGKRFSLQASDLPAFGEKPQGGSSQLGKIAGFVDAINVHSTPVFYLYPTTGPKRVKCTFEIEHLADVRDVLKQYATVFGLLEYPEGSAFADSLTVESIRQSPPDEKLPTLASLWGAAPRLGRGTDSVAVVRQIRDAEP